jgi:hypothetical protein
MSGMPPWQIHPFTIGAVARHLAESDFGCCPRMSRIVNKRRFRRGWGIPDLPCAPEACNLIVTIPLQVIMPRRRANRCFW